MKLTIGITVYNKEKYIDRCLNSVLKTEGIEEHEIICVDDGSTDDSPQILDSYAKKYPQVRVIHTDNHGEYSARQEIIKAAKDEWIAFVDCDDEVSEKMYSKLLKAAAQNKNIGIVVCGYQRIDEHGKKLSRPQMVYFGNRVVDTSKDKSIFGLIPPSSWNRIYRRNLLQNGLELENRPKILPDMLLFSSILPNVKAVAFVGEALYHYRINNDMVTSDMGMRSLKETEKSILKLKQYYKLNYGERYRDLLAYLVFLHVGLFFTICYESSDEADSLTAIYRETLRFLNKNFPEWKKNRYLSLRYIKKYPQLTKSIIAYTIFRLPIWPQAASLCRFLEKKCGLQLKW